MIKHSFWWTPPWLPIISDGVPVQTLNRLVGGTTTNDPIVCAECVSVNVYTGRRMYLYMYMCMFSSTTARSFAFEFISVFICISILAYLYVYLHLCLDVNTYIRICRCLQYRYVKKLGSCWMVPSFWLLIDYRGFGQNIFAETVVYFVAGPPRISMGLILLAYSSVMSTSAWWGLLFTPVLTDQTTTSLFSSHFRPVVWPHHLTIFCAHPVVIIPIYFVGASHFCARGFPLFCAYLIFPAVH